MTVNFQERSRPAISSSGSCVAVPSQATLLKDELDGTWNVPWLNFTYYYFHFCALAPMRK